MLRTLIYHDYLNLIFPGGEVPGLFTILNHSSAAGCGSVLFLRRIDVAPYAPGWRSGNCAVIEFAQATHILNECSREGMQHFGFFDYEFRVFRVIRDWPECFGNWPYAFKNSAHAVTVFDWLIAGELLLHPATA